MKKRWASTIAVGLFIALPALLAAEPGKTRWYPAGEAELVEIPSPEHLLYRLLSWEAYKALTRELRGSDNHAVLTDLPNDVRPLHGCGLNFSFAGKNRSFCVFGTEESGYGILADTDGDTSLRDEEWIALERAGEIHAAEFRASVSETVDGENIDYPVMLRVLVIFSNSSSDEAYRYTVQTSTVRQGVIRFKDRTVPFELRGNSGIYNHSTNTVWFDLDGDGQGGATREHRESDEHFYVRDDYFTLDGTTYRFEVDRYGRSLALTPIDERFPERPSLEPGTKAPGFQANGLDGRSHNLMRHQGSVVLLDFWSVGCGPCIEEAPRLASLHERHFEDGLHILGISPDKKSEVRAFTDKYDHEWPQILESFEGPIHAKFRVFGYPTKFLIDREGRILCGRTGAGFWEECWPKAEKALKP